MTDTLSITQDEGRVTVFHLRGVLNAATQQTLVQAAQQAHAGGARLLLIDLSEVSLVTSAGLQALEKTYQMFTSSGEVGQWEAAHPGEIYKSQHFKLGGATPQVHSILSIAGFLYHIPMYPTVQEALDSFGR